MTASSIATKEPADRDAACETQITASQFVRYIDRTRDYYRAQGYEKPYRWPVFEDVPFTLPGKPLVESTATLITTANEWHGDVQPASSLRRVYPIDSAQPPERFHTDDLSWHKKATHTDDVGTFFPLSELQNLVVAGRLGAVAARCHGVPTRYSTTRTLTEDAPLILERCREDGVDVAFLVPL